MRRAIVLSATAVLAAITFSNVARAESGPWYNGFQVEACKKNPNQAGCVGFQGAAMQDRQAVDVAPAYRKVSKKRVRK